MSDDGEPILGIDLGSAKICIAAVDSAGILRLLTDYHGRSILPAVVSFDERCQVLIGDDAVARAASDPDNTIACDLGPTGVAQTTRAGNLTPVDVAAILLDHVRRMADAALQIDTRTVVLTLPQGVDENQRQRAVDAANAAGLILADLVPCPVATTYAYGIERDRPQFIAVCDFGASKFECSVIAVRDGQPSVLATTHEPGLGGDALTERLVEWMIEEFQRCHGIDLHGDRFATDQLRSAAETGKRRLFPQADYGVQLALPQLLPRGDGSQLGLDLLLTEEIFDQRTADLIERVVTTCDKTLYRAAMTPEQLFQVILVGGSSRVPAVHRRLGAFFGRYPRMDVDPEAASALGAALLASQRAVISDRITSPYGTVSPPPDEAAAPPVLGRSTRVGRVVTKKMFTAVMAAQTPTEVEVNFSPPRPALVEVTASRLALSTVSGYCDEIIPANEPIPADKSRVFTTGKDGQRAVQVSVCQGDSRRFAENLPLGTIVLDNLPPRPRGEVSIAVTFAIDDDGVLEASACDQATGQAQTLRIQLAK